MPDPALSILLRYGGAVLAVVLGTAVRLALDPLLGDKFPFTTLLFAVLVVAGAAGRGPALLATALGALASALFLLPPLGSFTIPGSENQAGLVLYLAIGTGIALLGGALRAARDRAEAGAAEAIRQQEQWQATLSSIGDAVIVTNAQGRVTAMNPVAEMLTNWPVREAAGRALEEVFRIVNEDTRQPVESPAVRVLREGTVVGLANHTLLIARDGAERPIDDSAAPIRDEQGALSGIVLVFRDMTERHRAEEARRRLAAIVESADDAIVAKNSEGFITSWNAAAERLYGYPASEAVGQPFSILVPPDRSNEVEDSIRRLRQGERLDHFETVRLRKDGRLVDVSVSYSPIRDDRGRLLGTAVIARDITGPKRAEEALREQTRIAETLNRIGVLLAAELDLDKLVQVVTDEATKLTDAQFGAIFYHGLDEQGGSYTLISISGAPKEEFSQFPLPRTTDLFGPTFRGEGVVRLDDVRADPRFGRNAPYHGMPEGHLPVRSYLAVPILSRFGEVLGGLFFGHSDVGVFAESDERLVVGIAAQAAIAIDNARLYREAQESEGRFRLLTEVIPQLVWSGLPDGSVDYCNSRWLTYTGLAQEQVQGEGWAVVLHPDDAPATLAEWRLATATGQPFQEEQRLRGQDGRYRWFLTRALPLVGDDGRIQRWYGTCTDIEDSKRANEALQASEERLRLALQAGRMGTWDWNVLTNEVTWSPGLEAIHGLAPGTFTGTFAAFQRDIHPDDLDSVLGSIRSTLEEGQEHHVEYRLVWPDGSVHWVEARGKLFRDNSGRPMRLIGVCTDVTARKRADEQLRRATGELRAAKEEAEAANQAKTQFLAVLSHELRTPLNPILLATSALLERPAEPEELRPTLEMIRQNVLLQARLIDDLLDVMRIVRGKMPLHWEVADGHRLIDQAVQICRSEVQGKGLRLSVETTARHHHVNADPARLQQVFWNLIRNAIKFTPEGGALTVRTSNENDADEDRLVIEVCDTGIGIAAEVLPRIFDPFQQGETTITRKFGGLGLGLAICKGIVEAHGGTLEARSAGQDRGTTFRVVLKALPEPTTEGKGEPAGKAPVTEPVLPSSLRILVVEDEPATLRLMARLLRGLGHEVTTADLVASATEAFAAGSFDLIVSDIGLPDGSGLDLMRQVVARQGPVPAIALTGYGMEEDIRRSREAGFTAHLTKPIDFSKLQAMIRQVAPTRP